MQKQPRALRVTQLVTAFLAVTLAAGLAACGSAAASGSGTTAASRPETTAAPRSGTVPAAGQAAAAQIPAAARRVMCPAGGSGVVNLPGLSQPPGAIPPEPVQPGFRPVAVVECVRVIDAARGGGFRIAERRRVAVTGLGGLLAALRRPWKPRPKGSAVTCLAPVSALPWFVLISADGQVVHPPVPVGACGLPIPAVLAGLSSLHWITLSTTRLPPVRLSPRLHGWPAPDITPGLPVGRP